MIRKAVVGLILCSFVVAAMPLTSCKEKAVVRNSAVDKRKKQMSKRKQKKTELGCPLKDC